MIEEWRDVEGFEAEYQVSSHGRVKSKERFAACRSGGRRRCKARIMSPTRITKTCYYPALALHKPGMKRQTTVHRLVALAFIPNPENKREVNHKNGIKHDNRVENLEWVTRRENEIHSWQTGLRKHRRGYENPTMKLDKISVQVVREAYATGRWAQWQIAKYFKVTQALISMITSRKRVFKNI